MTDIEATIARIESRLARLEDAMIWASSAITMNGIDTEESKEIVGRSIAGMQGFVEVIRREAGGFSEH